MHLGYVLSKLKLFCCQFLAAEINFREILVDKAIEIWVYVFLIDKGKYHKSTLRLDERIRVCKLPAGWLGGCKFV